MTDDLQFGIQTNGIKHRHADPMPDIDTRFRMVREAQVFDYVDKTPAPDEVEQFLKASARYGLPVRSGGWFYTLDRDLGLLEQNLRLGKQLGSVAHNVQVMAKDSTGRPVSDEAVTDFYLRAYDIGEACGVEPCFEVHVNMWSEDFRRVARVGDMVERRGVPFRMTLDHSHVIFKIDNPAEQDISGIREDVASGKLILDPAKPGHVSGEWIERGWIRHCHARSAVPNNPKNLDARNDAGQPGRGIQYPFKRPAPGEYHVEWHEHALEPWKQVVHQLLRHRAKDPKATLGQISTEFIPNFDYGEGCRYSLFEQAIACVEWMRAEWKRASQA
jgi:hypothetical protein